MLLLDLDGTLSDNFPGISRSIVYALTRPGAPIPDEAVLRRCIGPPVRESFASLLDDADSPAIEVAVALYRERYSEVGWRENVVYDGVPQMLDVLAARDMRMVIGDRAHDVRAARMNGARSIGVLWGYGTREELAGADARVAAPAELPGAIASLTPLRGRA